LLRVLLLRIGAVPADTEQHALCASRSLNAGATCEAQADAEKAHLKPLDWCSEAYKLDKRLIGAPRSMKMGTIFSPWRYDAAAGETIQPDWQRRTTILRYASWAAAFPISLVVRLPFDSGPFDRSRDRRDGPNPDLLAI